MVVNTGGSHLNRNEVVISDDHGLVLLPSWLVLAMAGVAGLEPVDMAVKPFNG